MTVEELTQAFYDWELRGRGWQSFSFPVPLEPPFQPFRTSALNSTIIDDGRKPTWLSRLSEAFWGKRAATSSERDETDSDGSFELPEPEPVAWRERELLTDPELRVDHDTSASWLLTLKSCRGPIACELLTIGGHVHVRLATDEADAALVTGQLRAFFPGVSIRDPETPLPVMWGETPGQTAAVEFGLAREFMVPLKAEWKGLDPLTALVAGLAQARGSELGLVQVIFEPVRSPWVESILRAVRTPLGEPFFADAPELTDWAKEKVSTLLYAVRLRVAAKAGNEDRAWDLVRCIASGLALFGGPDRNELVPLAAEVNELEADLLTRTTHRSGMIWSAAELAALVHPPDRSVQHAALVRTPEPLVTAPAEVLAKDGLILGETAHRGETIAARLSTDIRLKHVHVIGASGTGKSTLLINLILQDIEHGDGLAVVDPHGDLVDEILARLPENRAEDVILFDPADEEYVVGWNILAAHSPAEKEMLASDLVAVFRRLSTSWGDQMTAVLANAILAFLESDRGGTLADVRKFLVDEEFRESFLHTVREPQVTMFWRQEFPLLVGKKPQAPILTRLDTFLRSRLVRDMVTTRHRPLDFRAVMDERRILLARLSQGAIGEENAALLGALLVSKFHQVGLTRQELTAEARTPFYLYIDEFQEVATPSMASLFSGVRKYRLGLTVAHQELYQLHAKAPEVERAALANAYTRICFRVGEEDGRKLERGLGRFTADDLTNLRTGEAICRVGRKDDDFRLHTSRLADITAAEAASRRDRLRRQSFERYGVKRSAIQEAPTAEEPAKPQQPQAAEVRSRIEVPTIRRQAPTSDDTKRIPEMERPRPVAPLGRGGPEHKYVQELIRQWGQARGFRVTIEHPLEAGGKVDVALERDGMAIACEVAMTTTVEHELDNLAKCLRGPFNHVITVSLKRSFLKQLESALASRFSDVERHRIRVAAPEELMAFLDEVAAEKREGVVAGYAVQVRYRPPSGSDERASKRAVADVVLRSLKRMKGTGT